MSDLLGYSAAFCMFGMGLGFIALAATVVVDIVKGR
jgi:hypothetical protein